MERRIIAVLIGEIGAALIAVVYPSYGLLELLFFTIGRPQDDRPNVAPLHIPMVLVIAIGIGCLIRLPSILGPFMAGIKRLWIILLLYALIALSAMNNWTQWSSNRLYEFTTVVWLCLLTFALVTSDKILRGYMGVLLASGAYVVIRVIRNPSSMHEEITGQTFDRMAIAKGGGGNFGGSNYLALLMVLTIFLSISLLIYYRSIWQRFILLALAGGSGYVFFRANSRGASLGLAAGALCLWIMQKRKLKATVIVTVIILFGSLLVPQSYWDRLQTVAHYEEDASATKRLELWHIALTLIPAHPILGVGPDNFRLYAPNSPHDAYLQIASEVGLPALLVYISMLVAALYSAWRARRLSSPDREDSPFIYAASQGVFCCLIAIVVQGFTTGLAHREFVYVMASLAFCLRMFAEKKKIGEPVNDATSEQEAPLEPAWPTVS
jgi:O-antigen ligase